MAAHFCKTSIQNTEAGGLELRVQDQSEWRGESKVH